MKEILEEKINELLASTEDKDIQDRLLGFKDMLPNMTDDLFNAFMENINAIEAEINN